MVKARAKAVKAKKPASKYEPKTKPTGASVAAFIDAVENDERRKDAKAVLKLMREITGEKPVMWGPTIIGFGAYETPTGLWPMTGFSPRKANLVLYVMTGFEDPALMKKLRKHKTGKSCLYINKLSDVDEAVLRELVTRSVAWMREKGAC
ncbi:MAG: DUF1801 domain-containing protein [Alphaproteobacteria bacterium]|nr:DUF1801 domain-containing protein [Alphaproteobacteria bacterium]